MVALCSTSIKWVAEGCDGRIHVRSLARERRSGNENGEREEQGACFRAEGSGMSSCHSIAILNIL